MIPAPVRRKAQRRYHRLWWLTGVLALAFVLRVYDLGAVPLRGDEAFAVRYWADDPASGISLMIDLGEPHPLGTYLMFWAWKSAAGDSEFAMRVLPLLGSLLGAAACAALARRLFRSRPAAQSVALCAALLWAINPFQIWHAQDVRNYALWAGLSPLAMWLFLRMVDDDSGRPSRAWVLYLLAETLALYTFFLEACMLLVQAAYVLIVHRTRTSTTRAVWRRVMVTWSVLGVALLPWFWHAWKIIQAGYAGTVESAAPLRLLTRFLPTLLAGPESATWPVWAALGWLAVLLLALIVRSRMGTVNFSNGAQQAAPLHPVTFDCALLWLLAWIAIPTALVFTAATRASVFHPRYIIASAPPLLILVAVALQPLWSARAALFHAGRQRIIPLLLALGVLIAPLAGLPRLAAYYRHTDPKAPDWPALAAYLDSRLPSTGEHLVLQTQADPAFAYYYQGRADEKTLASDPQITDQLSSAVLAYRSIWLIGRSAEAEAFLGDHMQRVSTHRLSDFTITQYQPWQPQPGEIATASGITFGDIVRLQGVTVQGPDSASRAITVLLYWEPLAQAPVDYKVFVHLLGPDGISLIDQDDHEPLNGFARTSTWDIGGLLRDPYTLLDEASSLPPGRYSLVVGLYDPATTTRLPVFGPDGAPLGDRAVLGLVSLP